MNTKKISQRLTNTIVIHNRKARFNYVIEKIYEAGLVLTGSEVKSIRARKAQISESYASFKKGELWLYNSHLEIVNQGGGSFHTSNRNRKLLLNNRELALLYQKVNKQGYTIIPLKLYFRHGYAKVELGLAKGKKKYDKRETIKKRDIQRQIQQNIKGKYRD